MKPLKLLAILAICLLGSYAKAQWVTIPQAFATYIATYITPTAINGSQLDTSNIVIDTLQNLTISNTTIPDITGIQYFSSLKQLVLSSNNITFVPKLPAHLTYFELTSNQLTTANYPWPDSLRVLKLPYSCIGNWPTLPSTLQKLILYHSCYTALPTLPNGLDTLVVDHCDNLTALPSVLPDSLNYLLCSNCHSLSTLPATLPNNLQSLYADDCAYTILPPMPSHLTHLQVAYNHISSLPTLPSSISWLDCNHSDIIALPALPNSMLVLSIASTPLSTTSTLSDSIVFFIMDSLNNINSFHNYPHYLGSLLASYIPKALD